jgi:hypothetical protein
VAAGDQSLASNAAAQNSATQLGITNQNDVLAQKNISNGLSGLGSLSGQETQQADEGAKNALGGTDQSFGEETKAYQPSNFWSGIGTSVLGMGLNAVAPGLGGIGKSSPQQTPGPVDPSFEG